MIPYPAHRGAVASEIAYLESTAQEITKLLRIVVHLALFDAITIGDAVTHARHLDDAPIITVFLNNLDELRPENASENRTTSDQRQQGKEIASFHPEQAGINPATANRLEFLMVAAAPEDSLFHKSWDMTLRG